jgi:TPR repeat protein
VKWYRKAADQGLVEAQYNLGVLCAEGTRLPKDNAEAFRWLKQAADRGYARAQNNLGVKFLLGDGVPRDYVQAYFWLNLAAANGNEFAKTNRNELEHQMTPSQIETAQKMSTDSWSRRQSVTTP